VFSRSGKLASPFDPSTSLEEKSVIGNIGMLEVKTEETYNLAALRIRIRDEHFGSYFRKLTNTFFG
jgi:hypothetical protein